jgi:nitrite reductase/ring-hydroxylating ferredoxin subunit
MSLDGMSLPCLANSNGPISRQLLGRRMVIFRTESGQTAIIADRCPHRFRSGASTARASNVVSFASASPGTAS